ncbi:MAG: fibronectin type III domain-containing protein [Methanomassiliicoccales archaeon]|nr:MAG: fibronectin type III domain-containing protein [Methanomassiliicoccales archaeon]
MRGKRLSIMVSFVVMISVIAGFILLSGRSTDDGKVPPAPTGLTLVPGEGEISISWQPPESVGSSDVIGYKVYIYDDDGILIDVVTINTTNMVMSGLEEMREYSVQVSAFNEEGEGPMTEMATVITLKKVIVPRADGMVLSPIDLGTEYKLGSVSTDIPLDMISLGLRSYALAEFLVEFTDPLTNWKFMTIEICVCATQEEAEALYHYNFNRSFISDDPSLYKDLKMGDGSKFYTQYSADGILIDGWFWIGTVVVHMEYDCSSYEPVVTVDWFKSIALKQHDKVLQVLDQWR